MKHFEVLLLDATSQIVEAHETDMLEAWWADIVVNNRKGSVILNGTSYPVSQLTDVQEAKSCKGSTEMQGT